MGVFSVGEIIQKRKVIVTKLISCLMLIRATALFRQLIRVSILHHSKNTTVLPPRCILQISQNSTPQILTPFKFLMSELNSAVQFTTKSRSVSKNYCICFSITDIYRYLPIRIEINGNANVGN